LGGLLWAEFAEGHADFHAERGDVAHDAEHVVELFRPTAHAFPGGSHAETGGSIGLGGAGVFHHLVAGHQRLALDFRFVAGGLRAIGAVFGTSAGLDREQRAKLDFASREAFFMHFARPFEEVEKTASSGVPEVLRESWWIGIGDGLARSKPLGNHIARCEQGKARWDGDSRKLQAAIPPHFQLTPQSG
jgi:hypothetical protein